MGILGAIVLALLGPAQAETTDAVESAVTIEQIAAQLERDPVFIQEVAGGGDRDAAEALVRDAIAGLPHPVFVVAGRLPIDDLGQEQVRTFAFELRRELQRDAVFAIAPLDGVPVVLGLGEGMPAPPRNYEDVGRVSEEMLRQFPRDFDEPEGDQSPRSTVRETALARILVDLANLDGGSLSDDEVRDLASHRFLHVVTADLDDAELPTPGKQWMVGTVVGALVLVWVPLLLRALGRRRRPTLRPGPAREPDVAWSVADADLEQARTQLSQAIAALDPARVRHPGLLESAMLAKEAADVWASASSQPDRLGALTLAERGLQDARRANRREPGPGWRPCFLDPRHGRASGHRQWVLQDAEVRVPLCGACARRMDRGEAPRPLLVRRGRGEAAYFTRDDVWARTGYGALIDDYAGAVLRDGRRSG